MYIYGESNAYGLNEELRLNGGDTISCQGDSISYGAGNELYLDDPSSLGGLESRQKR